MTSRYAPPDAHVEDIEPAPRGLAGPARTAVRAVAVIVICSGLAAFAFAMFGFSIIERGDTAGLVFGIFCAVFGLASIVNGAAIFKGLRLPAAIQAVICGAPGALTFLTPAQGAALVLRIFFLTLLALSILAFWVLSKGRRED